MEPLRPPFPKWYNAHTRCDYHSGNPGHSTENCIAHKREVQSLIKDGKLKFEESDGPVGVEDLFEVEAEMIRQKEITPREAGFGKTTISRDEVFIAKDKKSEASGLLTTERSKERLYKPNKEE